MKILNTIHPFSSAAQQILEQIGDIDHESLTQNELKERIGAYDTLLVGLGLRVDRAVIDAGGKLRIVASATTGLDHVDMEYAQSKGISVVSLRGEEEFLRGITGTAELAFGLLLSLVRHIPAACNSVKAGEWDRQKFCGNALSGKTLGIVGLGRLGGMMARFGAAFGMDVIAVDPEKKISDPVRLVSFDTLIAQSDVVSVHVHLTKETDKMFNERVFNKMKTGSYLINTARGKIVDEAELQRALERNAIAGYAADVLDGELFFGQRKVTHPLIDYAKKHDNVIITPHIGGATREAWTAVDVFIARKVAASLS